MDKQEQFWQHFLDHAKEHLSKDVIKFFVEPAELVSVNEEEVVIYLDLPVKQDYWETTVKENLIVAGFEVYQKKLEVRYVFERSQILQENSYASSQRKETSKKQQDYEETGLLQRYTFSNFIPGLGNQNAFNAAEAIAEDPGGTYNPLFLYGGPGLGKTHLINALGNRVAENFPESQILYISAENFTSAFIKAILVNNMDGFKERFRNLDLLLIDDVQALNKPSMNGTQEELFNTFESLYNDGKQIVLTSDRTPAQLDGLEERLVTRFSWGLITDVTPPDYETRIAILKAKTENLPYHFPLETYEYLANQFDQNVRDLEGSLKDIQLIAKAQNLDTITINIAAEAIRSRKNQVRRITVIPIDKIQEEVGKFYGISVKEIKGTKRVQHIVHARQVAMFLSREMTDNSWPKIGKAFGGKDHSTVMHAHEKIQTKCKENEALLLEIEEIKKKIQK